MVKKRLSKVKRGLKEVFKEPKYLLITLGSALLFFLLNLFIPNLKIIFSTVTKSSLINGITFLRAMIIGGINNMTILSFYSLTLISALVGITIALITYQLTITKSFAKAKSKTSVVGALLGLVAPGCASCGIGLLSAIGLTSTLAYLPFKGAELGMVSIALLLLSVMSLSTRIADGPTCRLNFKKKR